MGYNFLVQCINYLKNISEIIILIKYITIMALLGWW